MSTLTNISSLPYNIIYEIENSPRSSNSFNYFSGMAILFLNKIRHELRGYTSARGFDFEGINRAINYDFRVVNRWVDYLEEYEKGASNFSGKNILELGPGADLV